MESSGEEALFDLERDPQGYADVAADPSYAGRLQEARLKLLQRLLSRAACPAAVALLTAGWESTTT